MDAKRKTAKKWLEESSRAEYGKATHEAKLTPRQQRILNFAIIEDLRYWEIAAKIGNCQETVKTELRKAYDKIYNVII